ncbi:MAG TPA: hypothetical protein VF411_13200 [Bacteroidia bacterium]
MSKIIAQLANPPTSFSQDILYKEQLLGTNLAEVRKAWWHNRLEPVVQYGFIRPFLDKVKNNNLEVYTPKEPFKERITNPEANSLLFRIDSTMYIQNYDNPEGLPIVVPKREEYGPDKIRSAMFNESWVFDADKMTFEKTVKGIVLNKSVQRTNDNGTGAMLESYLFYIPFHQAKDNEAKEKLPLLAKRVTYDVRIKDISGELDTVTYTYSALLNGAKIETSSTDSVSIFDENGNEIKQKIEVVDTIKYIDKNGYQVRFEKNKIDTVQYPHGLTAANIKTSIAALYTPVINGKLTAYSPIFPYDKELSKADIKAIMERKDTVMQPNRMFTYETDTIISKDRLAENQVTSLRFYESWYYDSTQTVLYKKVHGVMLLRDIIGKSEYEWGSKELFYIPLNETKPSKKNKKDKPTPPPAEPPAQISYSTYLDSVPYFQQTKGIDTIRYTSLMDAVISGAQEYYKFTVGDAWYRSSILPDMRELRPLTSQEIKDRLNPIPDTVDAISFDQEGNEVQVKILPPQIHIQGKDIRCTSFIEDWAFDADKLHFSKTVRGIFPSIIKFTDYGAFKGFAPLFYIPFAPDFMYDVLGKPLTPPTEQDYNTILKPENSLGENILYYAPINTDDSYNDDGTEVSAEPSWNENLDYSKKEAIVKKLIDLTLKGKIIPYSPNTSKQMSIADFKKIMMKQIGIDTMEQPIYAPMKYYDVTALGFEEAWYANLDKLLFYKSVKKLYFATYKKDSETGITKYNPLVYFILK